MNLQQLEYFRDLAQTQNMTKSSQRLHISQPAMSNALRSLERELEVTLFDRKGKTIRLNETGEEFLKSVNAIFEILGRNRQKSLLDLGPDITEIVIGGLGTESGLLTTCKNFAAIHPKVRFRFVSNQSVTRGRAEDTVDFLISARCSDHFNRHYCKLWDSRYHVVMAKDNPLSQQKHPQLCQFKDERFVLCAPSDVITPKAVRLCVDAGFVPQVHYISDDRLSVLLLLLQDDLVALVPQEDALLFARLSADLVALPVEYESPETGSTLLSWKSEEKLSPEARKFLQYIFATHHTTDMGMCEGLM